MQYLMAFASSGVQYLQSIRINDVIDIAIIAFLVYQLLMFARRSNMGGVLKGILLVFVAIFLAEQFNLNAMSFIMNRLVEVGILALVIVFQPEVRHWLEQMGKGVSVSSFLNLRTSNTSEVEETIKQTVYAYSSMSRDKVGALIVFERRNSLEDVIKNGTPMDCSVNAELLKNLFWNKAPLHDGAVIIRDGRIVSAGCMLPMSSNANLSKDLGMRHRAGIGVSEHTDAVVAIVSEETGGISVAVGGMLKRHLAPETLERILRNELLPNPEDSRTGRKRRGLKRARKQKSEDSHGA